MAHSWYFVPSWASSSEEYEARTSATSVQGSWIVRNGLRIRMRSSSAKTAGRRVNATTSGTTRSSAAAASQGTRPSPRIMASPAIQAISRSSSDPQTSAATER